MENWKNSSINKFILYIRSSEKIIHTIVVVIVILIPIVCRLRHRHSQANLFPGVVILNVSHISKNSQRTPFKMLHSHVPRTKIDIIRMGGVTFATKVTKKTIATKLDLNSIHYGDDVYSKE